MAEKQKKAVAVYYDGQRHDAPEVLASGKGIVAENIIEVARRNKIEIVKDEDLVEVLSKVPVGQEIPENLYVAIAEVLAFVYKLNRSLSDVEKSLSTEE